MFMTGQLIITVCYGAHSVYLPNAIVLGTAFQFSEKQTVTSHLAGYIYPGEALNKERYLCLLE